MHQAPAQITERPVPLLTVVPSVVAGGQNRPGKHLGRILEIEFPLGERRFAGS
jgi:hypothetical protein